MVVVKVRDLAPRQRGFTKRRGFTLLELLVVIGIMSFLMSLLLPSLKRSMDLAKATSCKINLRQLSTALQLYRIENNGWLPVATPQEEVASDDPFSGSIASDSAVKNMAAPWFSELFPIYMSEPKALACPEDPYGYRVKKVAERLRDPIAGEVSSYGINSFIATAGDGYLANIDRHQPSRPMDTILVGDIGPDVLVNLASAVDTEDPDLRGPSRGESRMLWSDGYDPFFPANRSSWVTRRHGHGIHMATLAGEIRSVKTEVILRQPVRKYYSNCAAGGCTFCNELEMFHYSFAKSRLFWWTGSVPKK
jgi:prepilin-type N-terminal cleavage/methylation domain-containing protein